MPLRAWIFRRVPVESTLKPQYSSAHVRACFRIARFAKSILESVDYRLSSRIAILALQCCSRISQFQDREIIRAAVQQIEIGPMKVVIVLRLPTEKSGGVLERLW